MSVMSNLAYEIEQLYIDGLHPTKIAKELGCPLSMVYDWLQSMGDELDEDTSDSDYM
jgi:DNA-directed RNA polymerase specialized sigma24 family protein